MTIVCCTAVQAQQPARNRPTPEIKAAAQARMAERKELIAAQKAAFITSRTGMSREEAEKFWPVYNQNQAELAQLRTRMKAEVRRKAGIDEMTDEELKSQMEKKFQFEEEKLKLEKQFYKEYLKLLPARKVAKLYKAEDDFKKEILREIQGRRGKQPK